MNNAGLTGYTGLERGIGRCDRGEVTSFAPPRGKNFFEGVRTGGGGGYRFFESEQRQDEVYEASIVTRRF